MQQRDQSRHTDSVAPAFQPDERFEKVIDQKLLARLEKAIGIDSINFKKLDPADFTPKSIADKVLEFTHRAYGQLQSSQASFDKETFFRVAKQGIDAGFKEAGDFLKNLGVFSGQIRADIEAAYSRIQEGLAELESDGETPFSSLAIQSRHAKIDRSVQIEITTLEGDTINIGLEQSASTSQGAFDIEQEGASVSGFQSQSSSRSDLTVTIEGELSEDEQASLKHLLQQMDKVGRAFFDGNVKAAFHHAGKLGIDSSTIAGISMNLEMTRSVQAIAAYQQTRIPEQRVQPDNLRQISDFFQKAREMLTTAQAALASFEDPLSAFNELFAGVSQVGRENSAELDSGNTGPLLDQLVKPLAQSILNDAQTPS